MIRMLIADDHVVVRSGLKQIFTLAPEIEVMGEAASGTEVMDKLRHGEYDILLMDMTMPGINGIELITRVRAHHPKLPILVLSMHNEVQVVIRALKSGANGYLTKDSEPERLIAGIRKVAQGGRFIDTDIAEQLAFESLTPEQSNRHAQLSNREFEIFRLIAAGKTVNEIADQLSISNKTVSTHKARLREKMNFASMADLMRYAIENKLT